MYSLGLLYPDSSLDGPIFLVMGYINAGFLLIMITPIGLAFKDFSFENVMGFADAVGFFCRDTFNLSNFVRSWCLKNDQKALLF